MKVRTTLLIWFWLLVACAVVATATLLCIALSWLIAWSAVIGVPVAVAGGTGVFAAFLAHADWDNP